MYKRFTFLSLLLFTACGHHTEESSIPLTSIQLIDRHGFSETVSAKERLSLYQNVDFLTPQPYQKVTRVFKRDQEGKTHSSLTSYHTNGQVSHYLDVVDGRAHGYYREWHANGQMKIEAAVIEGIADLSEIAQSSWLFEGISRVWNEEGACLAKISYSKGVLEGPSLYYYPSGKLRQEIPYKKDEIDGVLTVYAENGNVLERISFQNGLKDGLAVGFWEDRSEKYTETYAKDQLMTGVYFEKNRKKIAEVIGGVGKQALFEQDHLSSLVQIEGGKPEGLVQIFGQERELVQECHVKEGKKHGEEITYYAKNHEGKILPKLMVTWSDDQLHGVTKTWYPTGLMQSQREMSGNKKHGMSFAWYKDGTLMFNEEYENDRLDKGIYFKKGEKEVVSKIDGGKGVATLFDADGKLLKKINYEKGKPLLENDER
ncbi:MAG: toxin-antitoxin system YwqK family antitoxin [Chlamydiales bacterium]